VPTFRCYALDRNGQIVVAENVEAGDANGAVHLGRQFVALRTDVTPRDALHQVGEGLGLEIWQGGNLVFTTLGRPGRRPAQP
jgi:hypothetical protein